MYYVSTAFVANPPGDERDRFAGARAYIASKIAAERLIREGRRPGRDRAPVDRDR